MRWLIGIITLPVLAGLAITALGSVVAAQLNQTLSGGDSLTVNCSGTRLDQQRLNQTTRRLDCVGPTPTATPVPPTATSIPPTATATHEPHPTATPGGHDTTVCHGPDGHTHEHGDCPPPSWWPTSGPCAGIAFQQMAIGREDHPFYKHYTGQTSNGVQISVINHVAPNASTEDGLHNGRIHGDHDETILFRDRSGNYSCWQGLADYSPRGQAITAPITVFVKPCDGGGPEGPIILVDCGLASESWYEEPGAAFCDNSTHINGVWTDINNVRRGDGTSRHMEIQCYAPRLPGPNAVFVAPTLAQDCVVTFGICQYRVVTQFAKDYGSAVGPN